MLNLKKYIYEYEPLWGKWYFNELLGGGNDGEVFKISREEWGYKQVAAVKIISIDDKMSDISINKIINKIQKLYKLSSFTNILTYQDHLVLKNDMWHILAKTEYLPPLSKIIQKKQFAENDSIRLGINICDALEKYHDEDIVHENIKESNIFIDNEQFKLGDFYMSKGLPNEIPITQMKDSRYYAAPEIILGNEYDKSIDFYSLGIVLYKLFNNGLFPFLSNSSNVTSNQDIEEALNERFRVKELPPPRYGSSGIKQIILKACSFYPENRYSTAIEFKNDLLKVYYREDNTNQGRYINSFRTSDTFNINNSENTGDKITLSKSALDNMDENIDSSKNYTDIQSLDINENMGDVTIIGNIDLSKYKKILEEEENKKKLKNESIKNKNTLNTIVSDPIKLDDGSVELTKKTTYNNNTNMKTITKQNGYLSDTFITNSQYIKKESNRMKNYENYMVRTDKLSNKVRIIIVVFILLVVLGVCIKIFSN